MLAGNMSNDKKRLVDLGKLTHGTVNVLRGAGDFASSSAALPRAFAPIAKVILSEQTLEQAELAVILDELFEQLYQHPISEHSRSLTAYLRRYRFIPNEESTENLIRYLVKQVVLRSPVDIPEVVMKEGEHTGALPGRVLRSNA